MACLYGLPPWQLYSRTQAEGGPPTWTVLPVFQEKKKKKRGMAEPRNALELSLWEVAWVSQSEFRGQV